MLKLWAVGAYLTLLIALCEAQAQPLRRPPTDIAVEQSNVTFLVKAGADVENLHPVMFDVFRELSAAWAACDLGTFTITSGSEFEPLHRTNSWHHRGGGRAVDVRANNLSLEAMYCATEQLQIALPSLGCAVVVELHTDQPARRHLHVQCPEH